MKTLRKLKKILKRGEVNFLRLRRKKTYTLMRIMKTKLKKDLPP